MHALGPRLQIPRHLEELWLAMELMADRDEEEQVLPDAGHPTRLHDSGAPASIFTFANPLCTVVTKQMRKQTCNSADLACHTL